MSKVPVAAITRERLRLWGADCERDHATPLVLVAIGHDARSGVVHVYRPQGGPADSEIARLLQKVADELTRGTRGRGMIEVWTTVELTDQQYKRLCDVARERYPQATADRWPASMLVPNLMRDLLARTLEPLIGVEPPGYAGSMPQLEPV